MTLHDRIMALPLVEPYAGRDYEAVELRNHASDIAKEADELMAEMAAFISVCDLADNADLNWAEELEQKYRAWKERTQ